MQMNPFKSTREKRLGIFTIMEENWIKINKDVLFSNWLTPRNYHLV